VKNVVQFPTQKAPEPKASPPDPSDRTVTIEQVAKGISICLLVTHDQDVTRALLKIFNKAVNTKSYDIDLSEQDFMSMRDYLDGVDSEKNREWSKQALVAYYSPS